MRRLFLPIFVILNVSTAFITQGAEGEQDAQLAKEILARDSQFWTAYNSCNLEQLAQLFTEDIEFYHDQGGATIGLEAFMDVMEKGLCSGDIPKLRREAIPETETIYPLRKGYEIYGAIMSGEHQFYVQEPGGKEYLETKADFTNLWLKIEEEYKIARVLSFDHRRANERVEIELTQQELRRFIGFYRAPTVGEIIVESDENHLVLKTDNGAFHLYPTAPNLFFTKERDLTFEFLPEEGNVEKMIVRERGEVVEEAVRED